MSVIIFFEHSLAEFVGAYGIYAHHRKQHPHLPTYVLYHSRHYYLLIILGFWQFSSWTMGARDQRARNMEQARLNADIGEGKLHLVSLIVKTVSWITNTFATLQVRTRGRVNHLRMSHILLLMSICHLDVLSWRLLSGIRL